MAKSMKGNLYVHMISSKMSNGPLTDTAFSDSFCTSSFRSQRGGIGQFIIPKLQIFAQSINLVEIPHHRSEDGGLPLGLSVVEFHHQGSETKSLMHQVQSEGGVDYMSIGEVHDVGGGAAFPVR